MIRKGEGEGLELKDKKLTLWRKLGVHDGI